jgi:hypothetical protein
MIASRSCDRDMAVAIDDPARELTTASIGAWRTKPRSAVTGPGWSTACTPRSSRRSRCGSRSLEFDPDADAKPERVN